MKITDVKSFPVWAGFRNVLVVKVETDEGIYGLGESGVSSRELAVQGAIAHFRQFLLGRDPMRIGALWQEMYRGQYFEGGRVLAGAISAIDIALYDIVAKKLGVPVYQLLGGAQRDKVPCFVTSPIPLGPETVEDAKRLAGEGWTAMRFVPSRHGWPSNEENFEPRESIASSAEWLRAIRQEVGESQVLGIDYHHRLSVAEAISFCQKLQPDTLDFVEEPIRAENPDAYAVLRQATRVPFAIGEEFSSKWAFVPFIERGLANFARIDVCNVGGFTEAMKVAGWCEAHYIDLMPHNPLGPISTAVNIHFAAAVPNYAWLELVNVGGPHVYKFDSKVFPVMPKLEGNSFPVPESPGLGVDFDEEEAKETFKFWEAPHLRREDGSYTNW